jgi:putative ABC transport system permease protein
MPTKPNATLPDGSTGPFSISVVKPVPHGFEFESPLYVATPQVLALYHIAPSSIPSGTEVITSLSGLHGDKLALGFDKPDLVSPVIRRVPGLPTYSSAPTTLIMPRYAASLGLTSVPAGWLVQATHPLTAAQLSAASNAAAPAGLQIEARNKPDHSLQHLRDYSTVIGVLVALGVLLMTVGLIRSETANDLRTLSATGASGSTRRTLTAATAGILALLGGVLGTAGCYIALWAWNVHDLSYLAHPPGYDLLALTLGLPVAAVVIGWLTAFRAPQEIARRPLE